MFINNDGPTITDTDYFDSDLARRGLFYLSTNAGVFRLLVPPSWVKVVGEMATAKSVVVSRGPWPAQKLVDAVEVLFDDGTDSPFALHLDTSSLDRLPLDSDAGRTDLTLTVWTILDGKPTRVLSRPARYRRSPKLPDLRPWTD